MTRRRTPLVLAAVPLFLAACATGISVPSTATPAASPAAVGSPPAGLSTQGAAVVPAAESWRIIAFSFVSATQGWLVRMRGAPNGGPMQVLHTTDGGDTWTVQYDATEPIPVAMQFIDAEHGWIAGTTGYAPFGGDAGCHEDVHKECQGALLSTADGGKTWHLTTPSLMWPTEVHFVDPAHGWILAPNSCHGAGCTDQDVTVFQTDDGGSTWQAHTVAHLADAGASTMSAIDARRAVVLTGDGVYATGNAGASWGRAGAPGTTCGVPRQVSMLDASVGWALCSGSGAEGFVQGGLYQTTDGGRTWHLVSQFQFGMPTPITNVGELPGAGGRFQFLDEAHGWLTTGDHGPNLYSTADGGHTWKPFRTSVSDSLEALQFVDAQYGWVANLTQIARTTDAAAHWTQLTLPG